MHREIQEVVNVSDKSAIDEMEEKLCATESLKKLSKVDIARPSSALLNSASCSSGQAYGLNVLLYYLYLFFESLIFKIV